MRNIVSRIRVALLFAAAAVACIAIHEAGHALAGAASGGKVTKFSVVSLRPHVSIQGQQTPQLTMARAVAGSSFVILAWGLGMLVAPAAVLGRPAFHVLTCFAATELLGWSLAACLYPRGPRDTDAWKFLNASGIAGLFVLLVCLLLALSGVLLYRKRSRRV